MRPLHVLLALGLLTTGVHAEPDARAVRLLDEVPATPKPLMFRDVIREHGWRVDALVSMDADEGNIRDEGYRQGDVFLDVSFVNASFQPGEICGFGKQGVAPAANFLLRRGHWIAESPLATWVLTGRCPH